MLHRFKLIFLTIFIISLLSIVNIYAEESESANYKLTGVSFSTAGDESSTNDGLGDLRMYSTVGEVMSEEKFNSSTGSYSMLPASPNVLVANVPLISCFETQSSGSTDCTHSAFNPDGVVMLCGFGGCFDRARFEIDPQDNPIDTLYAIQIKEIDSPNWSYIDGVTFLPKSINLVTINDFLSKDDWESASSVFNILGLDSGKEYQLRAQALHGDFTLSDFGPSKSAFTALPSIHFDLDIAGQDGFGVETNEIYKIDFGVLSFSGVNTADDLIWLDLGTNLQDGLNIYIEGKNGGLQSQLSGHTIISQAVDLDSVASGFGMQVYSSTQQYLGPVNIATPYSSGGENVGFVEQIPNLIADTSSNPIFQARASFYLKTKVSLQTPASDDYEEIITFTLVGTS